MFWLKVGIISQHVKICYLFLTVTFLKEVVDAKAYVVFGVEYFSKSYQEINFRFERRDSFNCQNV